MKIKPLQFHLLSFLILYIAVVLLNNDTCLAVEAEKKKLQLPIEVSASVNHNEVTIGDKVNLTIKIVHDPEIEVTFPEFGEKLAEFTIKDYGKKEPKKLKTGKIERKEWYALDTFLTGSYVIPPLTVKYKTPDGNISEIETNEIFVEVKSVMKEGDKAEDIRAIRDPIDVPVNYTIIYIIAGGVVGLAVIIFGTIYYIRQRRNKRVDPGPPPLPAHEIAYRELNSLEALDLVNKGLIKEYFYRLSNILRFYIERRFGVMAPERTTEEFLYEITKNRLFADGHKVLVKDFMEQCDLVKFAKYGPDKDEINGAFNAAKRLVDETKEVVEINSNIEA